jgi:hypothetical protein
MQARNHPCCLLIFFFLCLFVGCHGDRDNSTNPDLYELSDIVIIVDNQNPHAVRPPCGTTTAVCGTITDGLLSAREFRNGVPTVLVKPGTYNMEPNYPIQIATPVFLKSEKPFGAIIREPTGSQSYIDYASSSAFEINIRSAGVTIEGFTIINGKIHVVERGNATISESRVELEPPCGIAIAVASQGRARIVHNEIQGTIEVYGEGSMLQNNTISSACSNWISTMVSPPPHYGSTLLLYSTQSIITNNTITGNLLQSREAQTEFTENTIYGHVSMLGGVASFANNLIIKNDYTGISVNSGQLTLTANTFVAGNNYYPALLLGKLSTVSISKNRFDSEARGIAIITCEDHLSLITDGTNTLLNDYWIACNGLPLAPGRNPF